MLANRNIKSFLSSVIKNPTAINIASVALITLLVKAFGFYKEIIIAGSFGLSELLDTFLIASLVPGFIYQVFLGAFKSVFIPNYIAEQETSRSLGSFQVASFVVTIVTTIIFTVFAYFVTDLFLEVFFPDHTPEYYKLIKDQFIFLLPCIMFWGLSSLLSGLLDISNEFRYSVIYPIFTSIVFIIFLYFLQDTLGETILAVSMLVGSILEFLFLTIVVMAKGIIKFDKPEFKSEGIKTMFSQLPAKISSGFLTGLIPITDQYFAAQLIVGSIAALNYALKIPAFIMTLAVLALSRVLLPYFSRLHIKDKLASFNQLNKILKWVFLGLVLALIPIMLFSDHIVALVFERKEFTSEDTLIVSSLQVILLVGAPFYICGNILVQFLTSINKNAFMAYVSFISMALNIILDYIFLKFYGLSGIVICTTVIYVVRSLILLIYTNKQRRILV